ncbi:hypothetical protein Tco_1088832, partial [Tanacetum coccineum]
VCYTFDPFPSTDEPKKYPLREFLIKFLVLNGQRQLTLDFKTFCATTGLDYNNGKYVAHPTLEVVKKELEKIAINPSSRRELLLYLLEKQFTLSIRHLAPVSSQDCVDIGEIIYSDLVTKLLNKSRLKYVSYPRFISCALKVLLDKHEEEVLVAGDDIDEDIQADDEVRTPSPKQDQPEPSHEGVQSPLRITEKQWEQHEEATVSYADIKASIDQYYDENIPHRDQTDKLMEACMSSLDRSSTTISDLYKGLDFITQLLMDINNVVKDDPGVNQKINEATETFVRISSNITKVLSLVKGFNFSTLLSTMKDLQAHALKQEEASAAWTKSSTNMALNLRSRMTAAFKGQPSSTPSSSVTLTLALTHIPANVKEENATNTATEEPTSHTKGETGDTAMEIQYNQFIPLKIDKGKGITTESDEDPSKRLVPASTIIRPDPDEPDKEEKMKKDVEEAKLLAMSRPELNRRRAEEYMWTMTNRIKPEPITDVRINPNTKPIVAFVFRNNDKRNFDVHQPFKFSDFGIIELDELVPEQASSQTSGRKRKHMELEPEVKVPGLEYNRSLPEGVPFVNHIVIEEPEYRNFFIDVFGDQAFQRWDDIYKVGVESLVSYLVMASMVKTGENARFSLMLRKMIADYPYQDKLKSKKVKLEALGCHVE